MKQNSEPKGRIYDLQARIANAFIISERSDGRQIIQKGFKAFPLNQNLYSILNYKARIHILGYQLSHFLLTNIEIFRCFINGKSKFIFYLNFNFACHDSPPFLQAAA